MAKTNGAHTRIAGTKLVVGLRRYRDSEDHALWRFEIMADFTRPADAVFTCDASPQLLIELGQLCNKGLETLRTDGGRLAEDAPDESIPEDEP